MQQLFYPNQLAAAYAIFNFQSQNYEHSCFNLNCKPYILANIGLQLKHFSNKNTKA